MMLGIMYLLAIFLAGWALLVMLLGIAKAQKIYCSIKGYNYNEWLEGGKKEC